VVLFGNAGCGLNTIEATQTRVPPSCINLEGSRLLHTRPQFKEEGRASHRRDSMGQSLQKKCDDVLRCRARPLTAGANLQHRLQPAHHRCLDGNVTAADAHFGIAENTTRNQTTARLWPWRKNWCSIKFQNSKFKKSAVPIQPVALEWGAAALQAAPSRHA